MQMPVVGQDFEGFRVEALLGEGGFGAVYRARDSAGRDVALKVLRPEGAGYARDTLARFAREVAALAKLRSEYTVQLMHHGTSKQGVPYMVFEYLRGRDLRAHLRSDGPLDPETVRHILCQILISLDEAHRLGLIHRDIKPDNIHVLDTPGRIRVKLLDFGIARATDDGHPSITATGILIGTPRYMSPEQLRANPLTPRSDLYSLGMVAIELLVGESALKGGQLSDQFERLLSNEIVDQPQLAVRAGPLLNVIKRLTALAPEARYPSAAAALSDLDGGPPAEPMRPVERDPRPSRPWGVYAGVAAVLLLLLVIASTSGDDRVSPEPRKRNIDGLLQPKAVKAAPPTTPVEPDAGTASHELPPIERPTELRPSAGCGGEEVTPGEAVRGGHYTYLPARYSQDDPHPVLIVLRMDRQTNLELIEASSWRDHADDHGFVVLAPDDASKQQGILGDARTWRETGQDMEAVRAFYESEAARLCLDRSRVFVLAVADGGRLAPGLICEDWITGLASTSFIPNAGYFERCRRPESMPVMLVLPRDSPQLKLDGTKTCEGNQHLTAEALDQLWVRALSCREPVPWGDPARAQCREWTCAGKVPFVSCIAPGGVGWRGSRVPISYGTRLPMPLGECDDEPPAPDYPAEPEVWAFFESAPPNLDAPAISKPID